ncbi:MAG: FixH family protein [Flavihumibacter sp.]
MFTLFIGYMVYRAQSTTFYLVEKDYYKKELHYQDQIDAMQRTAPYLNNLEITRSGTSVDIQLPAAIGTSAKGEVWIYCPDNADLDQHVALATDAAGRQRFEGLSEGKAYTMRISWKHNNQDYYVQKAAGH